MVTNTNATTTRPGRKVIGERRIGRANVEVGVKDGDSLDLDMALSKIKALSGMIRAQEEIEILLGQELNELKSKQAGNPESVWKLLTRYNSPSVDLCAHKALTSLSHVIMSMPRGSVLRPLPFLSCLHALMHALMFGAMTSLTVSTCLRFGP